ncbi:hypothetical protein BJY04DRAFT_134029 [Aspergillus karnatakaensis]|uniref:putative UDP-glucose,sterol transferase n=1 Tax=Aspergillus karnatakaensis TaxID=1810916 RepID=UPI003CCDC935
MSHHDAEGISSEDWPNATESSGRHGQRLLEELDTGVRVMEDGRLDIKLREHKPWLQRIVRHTKENPYPRGTLQNRPSITLEQGEEDSYPLRLNIVIQVVGSRGDIQPFLAIGKRLHSHGHRVRLATHLSFRETVLEQGLEFFNIGGDPAELMAFMVKNPGLMPDMGTIRSGAIRKRRREMKEIFSGCWRSCFETGDGTGIEHHVAEDPWSGEVDWRSLPFVADVVIANPPSFAHLSCAEKLGVPLCMMFTMPWSATQAFPHPLANIQSQNAGPSVANFASYAIVEIMMWEGLGDLINRFRKRELGLDPLDAIRAPSMAHKLRIPYTYLWSPALLEKPLDWGSNIDVVGFSMLPGATSYTPPDDLKKFLDAGPPPVYIGFGSIVVDNAKKLTEIVFEAVKATGQRAVVSKGWGNIGADQADTPEIMMIDKCPHDWLFQHVSCVVHHGGAGTTAAGLALGKPTVIVPFFGDQTFWGSIVARAGAGPEPIPYKRLTSEKLAAGIKKALEKETLKKAGEIGEKMREEEGVGNAVASFYHHVDLEALRCDLCPHRPAVWWVKRDHLKLSAFAATVLVETGLLKPHDLVLYRAKEYDTSRSPKGPLSAGAEVLYGVVTDFVAAMAEFPTDIAEMLNKDHRRLHARSDSHLRHGQKNRPVHEWKKQHYAKERPDSAVGSSEGRGSNERRSFGRRSFDRFSRKSKSVDRRSSSCQSEDDKSERRKSSGRKSRDTAHTGTHTEGTKETEARDSSSISDASYSSAREQATETPDTDSVISRASTADESTHELSALSLEDTLRRQKSKENSIGFREVLTDARYHVTRAGKRVLNWVLLLPTDLTLSFSKGFHNAPKLYHDPMVQDTPTVRGVKGGLRAAGTEFTQEFYQGVTGIVTQPKYGRKEAGTKGMIKGVGKGIGGVFLKPPAGLWGLVGYPLDGVHKSLRNSLARSKIRDILSSRIRQGLGEMVAASPEERAAVIHRWNEIQKRTET